MLAVPAISGQAWWYHPTTPTTEITMDQDTARRIDQLEQIVTSLRQQSAGTASALNRLAESTTRSFANVVEKALVDDGAQMAERVIMTALLAGADGATRTNVQAALQVAYEAHSATNPHPLVLESFRTLADSVFPGIELASAAE